MVVCHLPLIFLVCSSEENDINPKVLQLIQGEKIKVREGQWELSSPQISSTGVLGLVSHKGPAAE